MNKLDKELSRINRITSDYTESSLMMANLGDAVTAFGSARSKPEDKAYKDAVQFGEIMGQNGISVITGGGPGVMQAANIGNSRNEDENVKPVGVGIELPFEEDMNEHLDISLEHKYFFTRKVFLTKHSFAFVCFHGGLGSLDEICEVACLISTKKMKRDPIVLVDEEYWGGFVKWMKEVMPKEGTLTEKEIDEVFVFAKDGEEAAKIVLEYQKNIPKSKRQ